MFVAVFGDSHPDVAATYQNLAALYQSQGNQAQTTEMATKAYHMIHEGPHNHG
jgi:hypothetical protein